MSMVLTNLESEDFANILAAFAVLEHCSDELKHANGVQSDSLHVFLRIMRARRLVMHMSMAPTLIDADINRIRTFVDYIAVCILLNYRTIVEGEA